MSKPKSGSSKPVQDLKLSDAETKHMKFIFRYSFPFYCVYDSTNENVTPTTIWWKCFATVRHVLSHYFSMDDDGERLRRIKSATNNMFHLYLLLGIDLSKKVAYQGLFELDNPGTDTAKPHLKATYFDHYNRIPFHNITLFNQQKKEASLEELRSSFLEDFQNGEDAVTEFFEATKALLSETDLNKESMALVVAKRKEIEKTVLIITPKDLIKRRNSSVDIPPGALLNPSTLINSVLPNDQIALTPLPPIVNTPEDDKKTQLQLVAKIEEWILEVAEDFQALPINNGEQWNIRVCVEGKFYGICYTSNAQTTNYAKNQGSGSGRITSAHPKGKATFIGIFEGGSEENIESSRKQRHSIEKMKKLSIVMDRDTNQCSIDWKNVTDIKTTSDYCQNIWRWKSRIRKEESELLYVEAIQVKWKDGLTSIIPIGCVNITCNNKHHDSGYKIDWDDNIANSYRKGATGVIKLDHSGQGGGKKKDDDVEYKDKELIEAYCKQFWKPETHGVRNKVDMYVRGNVYLLTYHAPLENVRPSNLTHLTPTTNTPGPSYDNAITISISSQMTNGSKTHQAHYQNEVVRKLIENYCTIFQDPPFTKLTISGIRYVLSIAQGSMPSE